MRQRSLSMLLAWMLSIATACCQSRQITGLVTEAGHPVSGAWVQVKNMKTGTLTDTAGRYALTVPNDATLMIVSAAGLKAQELNMAGLSEINVTMLAPDAITDEVVVTALGIERERKSLGYSLQHIRGDELRRGADQNMIQGLAGKAAGVYIQGSGGTPGASSKILLRGNATFAGDNQPLVVVDGAPIDNATTASSPGDNRFNANLAGVNPSNRGIDINPDDIESVDVLKGPAAAALYGVRAGAGAIIITTRKGANGSSGLGVDYSTSLEVSQVNKLPDVQMKYAQGNGGGVFNADKSASIGPGTYNPYIPYVKSGVPDSWGNLTRDNPGITPTDNLNRFFGTGYAYNNNISVTSHTDKSSIRLSLGRSDQAGVIPNTSFERSSVRITTDTRITGKFMMSGAVNLVNSGGNRAQNGSNLSGVMFSLLQTSNSFNLLNSDHAKKFLWPDVISMAQYTNPDGSQKQYYGIYDNPYWSVYQNPATDNVNRMLGNIHFRFDPLAWIGITYRLGTDVYTDQRKQVYAIGSWAPYNAPNGEINENILRYHEVYSDLLVTCKKAITKNLTGTLLLGNNLNHRYKQDVYLRGRDLGAPGNYNLNNASSLYSGETNTTIRTAALFFDLGLAWKRYLFVSVTGRNEWASTFGTVKNNFFYPSTNLSFIFSEVFKKIPKLHFGKIRAAYAQAGISPQAYRSYTYYSRSTYTDGFTSGLSFPYLGANGYGYSAYLGNAALRPEKITGKEMGIDLSFFNNRMGISFTYYNQTSTDLLVNMPIAPATGFLFYYTNAGSMVNKGMELTLTGTALKMKYLSWDMSINYSRNRNTVSETGYNLKEINIGAGFSDIGSYAIKGLPYGVLYGSRWERLPDGSLVIGSNGLPLKAAAQGPVGNPYPRWYGGIRNTVIYKNFTFSMLWDIRAGGDIWNGTRARLQRYGQTLESANGREKVYIIPGKKITGVDALTGDRIYADNDIKVDAYNYFRTYKGDGGNYAAENAIQDGGWVRMRDISISYRFDMKARYAAVFLKSIELGLAGRNLLLFTEYTGVDPETSLSGAGSNMAGYDYFNNPGTKSYTFLFKAHF